MTKKDYELLAKAIQNSKMVFPTDAQVVQRRFTASTIADALQADNPRFDRERFLKACGVTE